MKHLLLLFCCIFVHQSFASEKDYICKGKLRPGSKITSGELRNLRGQNDFKLLSEVYKDIFGCTYAKCKSKAKMLKVESYKHSSLEYTYVIAILSSDSKVRNYCYPFKMVPIVEGQGVEDKASSQ